MPVEAQTASQIHHEPLDIPRTRCRVCVSNAAIFLVSTNAQYARLSLRDECHGRTLTATDVSRVFRAYQQHGPVPHMVYWALSKDNIWGDLDTRKVSTVSLSTLEALLLTSDNVSDHTSSKLLCLHRRPDKDNVPSQLSYADVLSPFVADLLLDAPHFAPPARKHKLIALFANVPEVTGAPGWLYVRYMHRCLSQVYRRSLLSHQLIPSKQGRSSYIAPYGRAADTPYLVVERSQKIYYNQPSSTGEASPSPEIYWIPAMLNNRCFGVFVITQTAVFVFKIAVSDEHEVDSETGEGLSLLTRLLPDHIPWHYVLVIPRSGWGNATLTSVSEAWARHVESFQVMWEP